MHSEIRQADGALVLHPKCSGKLPVSLKQRTDMTRLYIVKRSSWQLQETWIGEDKDGKL